jgi:hypothetical protein
MQFEAQAASEFPELQNLPQSTVGEPERGH